MTELINIIQPDEDCSIDGNTQGLGLVDFEFMPHWDSEIYNIEELKEYSINSGRPLYLCSDADGKIDAVICIVDLVKKDSEIKILIGCTEEEKKIIYGVNNETEFMKGY